ncbi:MAG: deoxyribonuclease IV [Nitrospinota bacterium]
MKRVGAHVSASGGVDQAPLNAAAIGAKGFALFTKNQRQWKAKPLDLKIVEAFRENCQKNGFEPGHILPHDAYLINLGHPNPEALGQSREAFVEEMARCEAVGLSMLNFHPGSHLGEVSVDVCLATVAESVNIALEKTKNVTAVLENTAGQGNSVGHRFEQLREIIEKVEDKSRVGICLDTCHAFAAGYDLRGRDAYEKTMSELDTIVGIKYLKGLHLNDAKRDLGSKIDRHESIGKGKLGLDTFRLIMNDDRLDELPMILETVDSSLWKDEIALLYSLVEKG